MPLSLMCPCGSGTTFHTCCEPFLTGISLPSSPLQLMRSRYTAYSQANIDYIFATMRGIAAKNFDTASAKQWATAAQWERLEIIKAPTTHTDIGFVEFKAYYYQEQQLHLIHETSKFRRIKNRWYYISAHTRLT